MSGLLYKRNLLFFDRETDSLWSQLLSEAVTGPLAGTRLTILPAENTAWGAWRTAHPDTLVMSFVTGYSWDYKHDPYASYPLARRPALLVAAGGVVRIYPFSQLKKTRSPVADDLGGHRITIFFDRKSKTARAESDGLSVVTFFVSFLDDLKAFYPEAQIFAAPH